MVYKLIALEDIRYRIANSFPPNGFKVAEGKFILINNEGLKLFSCRNKKGRRGSYMIQKLGGQE